MTFGRFFIILKLPLILSVSWMLFFGLFQISMHMESTTGNCPFAPNHPMSICQMNPMEHIQEWQSMFTMLPVENMSLIIFALFAFLAITYLKFWNRFSAPEPSLYILNSSPSLLSFQIFSPLKELFSKGILNPKIF